MLQRAIHLCYYDFNAFAHMVRCIQLEKIRFNELKENYLNEVPVARDCHLPCLIQGRRQVGPSQEGCRRWTIL